VTNRGGMLMTYDTAALSAMFDNQFGLLFDRDRLSKIDNIWSSAFS
jgi:hypothetical protein